MATYVIGTLSAGMTKTQELIETAVNLTTLSSEQEPWLLYL